MFKRRHRLIRFTLFTFDLIVVTFSFFAAYHIRKSLPYEFLKEFSGGISQIWLLLPVLIIWPLLLWWNQLYKDYRTRTVLSEIFKLVKVTIFGVILLFALTYLSRAFYVSRAFLGIFGIINFSTLLLARLTILSVIRHYVKKGYDRKFVIIAGTGKPAKRLVKLLERHKEWGIEVHGFASDAAHSKLGDVEGYKVLGTFNDIPSIIKSHIVDEVYFAVSLKKLRQIDEIIRSCDEAGIKVHIVINYFKGLNSRIYIDHLEGIPFLSLSSTPYNETALFIKRLIDITFALLGLILTMPILILSVLAIKLTSKGPIVFKQKRVGMNGRNFTLYKLRTMYENAEEVKDELIHLNEMSGPVFKMANDPRITKVGKILRKFSVDELPQLWNILKGDMSLVGPRPPVPQEVEQYKPWQRRRLSMRPGLTCIWQTSGRNKINFEDWMKMDLEYIDNWSFGLDFKVILETIPAVINGKGAS